MDLREAKQILNENGYVLKEGKLGRALGIGALALGSFVGNANADWTDDFENEIKQTEVEQQNYDKKFVNEYGQTKFGYKINEKDYLIKIYHKEGWLIGEGKSESLGLYKNGDFTVWNGEMTWYNSKKEIIGLTKYIDGKIEKEIRYKNEEPFLVTLYKDNDIYAVKCRDGSVFKGKDAEEVYANSTMNIGPDIHQAFFRKTIRHSI